MNQHEQALLIQQVAEDISEAFKPRIREFEREGDRLIGEMNVLSRRLAEEQRNAEQLRIALGQSREAFANLASERERDQRAMLEISAAAQRWAETDVITQSHLRQEKASVARLTGEVAAREQEIAGLATERDRQADLAVHSQERVQELEEQIAVFEATLQDAHLRGEEMAEPYAALRSELDASLQAVVAREETITALEEQRDHHRRAWVESQTTVRDLGQRIETLEAEIEALRQERAERRRSHEAELNRHAEEYAILQGQREGDRLKVMRALAVIQEREQQLVVLRATLGDARQRYVLAEMVYDDTRRPKIHDHPTEAGSPPVIVLDIHETLTPSPGFVDAGQPGFMLPPYEGVRLALEGWAGQGICLHLATAALDPNRADPLVRAARKVLIESWYTAYGLPISWVTGKVRARVYYDDRMVPVVKGNWEAVGRGVEAQLAERSEMLPSGLRKLIDMPEQGELIEDYPDPADVPPDRPRGLSTRILDVDVHRCLSSANSSTREGRIRPGAREVLQEVWGAGYQVHLSCAGWDPLTHTPEESAQRLAGMRMQVAEGGIPYDQFVTKDHGTVFVDDKGITYRAWAKDKALILRTLGVPMPDDEVTSP